MGLEYITQPQVFTAPISAFSGIFGFDEPYPLLTTYQYWTSTATVPQSVWPIPGNWPMLSQPGSFLIAIGGILQPATEYTIDRDNRFINFNSLISADIEVSFTQLATNAPSSQQFDYVNAVSADISTIAAIQYLSANIANVRDLTATNLVVTNLSALSARINVVDVTVYELSGLTITGNTTIQGVLSATDFSVIDVNSTNAALRVTQRGSGNALEIEDFDTPDTTSFVVNNIGNVGIGTSTPGSKLTVVNDISATGNIFAGSQFLPTSGNNVSSPSFSFNQDTDTGIYSPGPNIIGFVEGGTEAARFDDLGNLGINTIAPSEKLTVSGNISANGTLTTQTLLVSSSTTISNNLSVGGLINGNFDGTVEGSREQYIKTNNLRTFFQVKANVNREVRTIFVQASGSGYTSVPTISVDPPTKSWGRQAVAEAEISGDKISKVAVIDGGTGYTKTPYVRAIGGGGSGANLVALADGNPLGEIESQGNCQYGNYNTTVLGNDGVLYSWGINTTDGILGTGHVIANDFPVTPVKFNFTTFATTDTVYKPRVVKFWKSNKNIYVIDQTGSLWGCGDNTDGQLGLGDAAGTNRRSLTRIPPSSFNYRPVIDFAVSNGQITTTCMAKTIDDVAYGWGHNTTHGALGLGAAAALVNYKSPTLLTVGTLVSALSASVDKIYVYGGHLNSTNTTGTISYITFKPNLSVWSAGANTTTLSQLGVFSSLTPIVSLCSVRLQSGTTGNLTTQLTGINSIYLAGVPTAVGTNTLFLDHNKTLYITGINGASGLLGVGTTYNTAVMGASAILTNVELVRGGTHIAATVASQSLYAYTTNGTLYSWGFNSQGQLASGDVAVKTTLHQVVSATNDTDNTTETGIGTRYLITNPLSGDVTWGPGSIADIAAAHLSLAVLRTDGKLYTAGYNAGYQLGTGDAIDRQLLQRVPDLPNPIAYIAFAQTIVAAAAAASSPHLIAILEDGSIYATGNNTNDQINSNLPTAFAPTFYPVSLTTSSHTIF